MEQEELLSQLLASYRALTLPALEARLLASDDREEKLLLRTLINLKLQLAQEKVIGETLL